MEEEIDLKNLPHKPQSWHFTWHYLSDDCGEIGEWCNQLNEKGPLRKSVIGWKSGKFHGRYIRWYEDGRLESYTEYKDGKLHGVCKKWSILKSHMLEIDEVWADGVLVKNNLKRKET